MLPRAGSGEAGQRIAGLPQLFDLFVERGYPGPGEFARSGTVVGAVEVQQLLDLVECKTGGLRRADELEPLRVFEAVAAYLAGWPRWLRQKPAALIVANGFDPYASGPGEAADRV